MADVTGLDVQVRATGVEAARSSIDRLDQSFGRASVSGSNLSSKILTLNQGFELIGRISRPFVGLASGFIDAASRVETLQARLVGLTGGTEQAAMAFERMRVIAANTPFQVPEVVQAGIQLKSMGVDASGALEKITDLASFMGRDLVETASAFGRSFSRGLGGAEVLGEGGIFRFIEAAGRRLKFQFKNIEDLAKQPKQWQASLLAALDDPAISGGALRVSATFQGRISNLADAWNNLQTRFGEIVTRSPAVRGVIAQIEGIVTETAKSVVDWTTANRGLVESSVQKWANELFRVISQIPDAIPGILRTADSMLAIGTKALEAIPSIQSLLDKVGAVAGAWNSLPEELRAFIATGATLAAVGVPLPLAAAGAAGVATGTLVNRGLRARDDPNNPFRSGPTQGSIDLLTQRPEFNAFHGANFLDIQKEASFGNSTAKQLVERLTAIERRQREGRDPLLDRLREVTPLSAHAAPAAPSSGAVFGPPAFLKPGANVAGAVGDATTKGAGSRGGGIDRNAAGAAEAIETRARTLADLQQQRLADLQRELSVSGQLVARSDDLIAAATQSETAERGRLQAQIEGLRVEQSRAGLSAGEREAIQARIEGLQQEAATLRVVRDVRAEVAADIGRESKAIRDLIGGPLAQYEEAMARARSVTGKPGGITADEAGRFESRQREQVLSSVGLSDGLPEAAEKWRQLDEAAARFGVTSDKIAQGQKRIVDELNGVADAGTGAMQELINATEGWGRNFTDTFASALEGAKGGWKDLLTSLLKDLNRLIINETITKPLFGAVRDALSGKRRYSAEEVSTAAGATALSTAGAALTTAGTGLMTASTGLATAATALVDAAAAAAPENPPRPPANGDVGAAAAGGGRTRTVQAAAANSAGTVSVVGVTQRTAAGVESAVTRMGTALGGVVDSVRSGFGSILGGLASGASAFLGALLGGSGGGGGGFFKTFGINLLTSLVSRGVSAAGSLFSGGGGEGVSMADQLQGLERDFDVKIAHRGGLVMHRGGIASALADMGGNPRLTGGGQRLAPDEVPAILQKGELVIPRRLAREVSALMGERPQVRRYHDGGIVDGPAAAKALKRPRGAEAADQEQPQNVFHMPLELRVVSLDPQNAAAVLLKHEREIVGMVNRNIRRGGDLAKSTGVRGGAK